MVPSPTVTVVYEIKKHSIVLLFHEKWDENSPLHQIKQSIKTSMTKLVLGLHSKSSNGITYGVGLIMTNAQFCNIADSVSSSSTAAKERSVASWKRSGLIFY